MNEKVFLTLKELGLNDTEIKVYIGLLRFGSGGASVLGKRLNIPRSTARHTLEQLAKKQLVILSRRNGAFYFTPENPQRILQLLEHEKNLLKEKEKKVSSIVGALQGIMNPHISMPKVEFFEGVEGVIKMYEDVLKEKKTIYGYSRVDNKNVDPKILQYLNEEYMPKRAKIGNQAFMIYNGEVNKEYLKNDKKVNRTTLILPVSEGEFKSCFHIYGNKIAFYNRQPGNVSGTIIEDETIKNDQFQMFRLAWNYARTLPENIHYKDISF